MKVLARISKGQWALATVLAAGFALWVISSPPDHGTINVSKSEYDSAMANWQSQRVAEYEMVVSYRVKSCGLGRFNACGTWKLRVDGDKVTILEYARFDTPSETGATGEDVKFLIVDGLFQEIKKTISGGPFEKMGYPLDYVISFDDGKGYPRDIRVDGRQRNDGSWSSLPLHAYKYIQVQSLSVLQTLED